MARNRTVCQIRGLPPAPRSHPEGLRPSCSPRFQTAALPLLASRRHTREAWGRIGGRHQLRAYDRAAEHGGRHVHLAHDHEAGEPGAVEHKAGRWDTLIARNPTVRRFEVHSPRIDPAHDGMTVAHMTDLHVKGQWST